LYTIPQKCCKSKLFVCVLGWGVREKEWHGWFGTLSLRSATQ